MQLETTRFGTVEYESDEIITLTQPILGFQDYRQFIFIDGPSDMLKWLHSVDSDELAFILMDPLGIMPDYEVELRQQELTELAVTSIDELDVYTLVVVPADGSNVRTNLKAPILVNAKQRLGKQVILECSDYPIQHFLAQAQPGQGQSQEVSNVWY